MGADMPNPEDDDEEDEDECRVQTAPPTSAR